MNTLKKLILFILVMNTLVSITYAADTYSVNLIVLDDNNEDNSIPVTHYKIYMGTESDNYEYEYELEPGSKEISIGNLLYGQDYFLSATAVNEIGIEGSFSPEFNFNEAQPTDDFIDKDRYYHKVSFERRRIYGKDRIKISLTAAKENDPAKSMDFDNVYVETSTDLVNWERITLPYIGQRVRFSRPEQNISVWVPLSYTEGKSKQFFRIVSPTPNDE